MGEAPGAERPRNGIDCWNVWRFARHCRQVHSGDRGAGTSSTSAVHRRQHFLRNLGDCKSPLGIEMIEKIKIAQVATFGQQPEVLEGLSQFNYLYGPNGSGKTTLSRLMATAQDPRYSTCEITWQTTPLDVLVYNRDFIARNFNASPDIKGIFTLGEKHTDTLKQISDKKEEIRILDDKIANLTATLQGADAASGKIGERSILEEQIRETIWTRKKEHETRFKGPLKGYLNSKDSFKSKILQERKTDSAT